jgi:integrase
MRIASDTFEDMHPKIAKAKAAEAAEASESKVDQKPNRMTVEQAFDLWLDRTERELGPNASVTDQYKTLKRKVVGWANAHGKRHVDEITTIELEHWYSSADWTHLKDTTRAQRWGVLRSVFSFLARRGVLEKSPADPIARVRVPKEQVQGPYTGEQVAAILASIEKGIPANLPMAKRPNYGQRLRTFMHLLLEVGLDVSDAVLHEPLRIERLAVGRKQVYVYRYRRIKTNVEAVVPISTKLAKELTDVPLEAGAAAEMPFRTLGLKLTKNQQNWSNRIAKVMRVAGVDWVDLPGRDKHGRPMRKSANVKQLRHTFAVRQLQDGQRPEDVARMLGHVDTEMIRRHYGPWVKQLDEAHIRRVVSLRAGM